ncbi:glucose-6-phosphate dehydrogenase assembly protein OpcA [Estrella lausannensis]|uniref:Uncharacterized protein n=1 Tax=Estrella lausannensis TaxID=483423 RepID=A0A0H5DNX2_9BACT|nr:glucose-6-phosphate dehydrogenase assembly protein OpcA [Estrella lausannensis]CRX38116.1 hypothetical protein ELAC_0764 [Estrella lausannensis]
MGKESSVHIIDIDGELKKLWDEQKHEKKIKACLLTLIIYTRDDVRGDYLREINRSIIKEFPCRIISITELGEDVTNVLTTEVSQHTSLEGGTLIASDQITIRASSEYIERIPFIVLPEIVPDLPVYSIWGAPVSPSNALLTELEKASTKVIFDAESSPPLSAFSKVLYQKLGKVPCGIADIHWAIAAGWRECFYQAFNREEGMRFLETVNKVKVTFNDTEAKTLPARDTLSWYFQAWLAGRMRWTLLKTDHAKRETSYQSKSGVVSLQIVPEKNPKFHSSSILTIELTNPSGDSYIFTRHPDWDKVVVHVTRKNTCELPFVFPYPDFSRGSNFMRELFFQAESDHYKRTLEKLSELS